MRKACSFFLSTFQHFHFQKILLWIQILLFEKGNFLGSVATEDCSSRGKRWLNIIWMWKSCRIKMSWKIWRRLILLLPGSAARWLRLYAWGTHCSRATWRGEEEILRAKCMISLLSNFRLRRWYSTLMQFHCQILCKTWLSTVFCFLNFRDCQIFTGP